MNGGCGARKMGMRRAMRRLGRGRTERRLRRRAPGGIVEAAAARAGRMRSVRGRASEKSPPARAACKRRERGRRERADSNAAMSVSASGTGIPAGRARFGERSARPSTRRHASAPEKSGA